MARTPAGVTTIPRRPGVSPTLGRRACSPVIVPLGNILPVHVMAPVASSAAASTRISPVAASYSASRNSKLTVCW